MTCTSRAWLVAASVGAVEALKDQGFCRWNYALRLLQQRAKTNLRSYAQAKKLSPAVMATKREQDKFKQSEESLRKVMYLSCWAPN
ncbi:Wound-responsive family protein [Perilla frutescens var. hirtella]|uniref:Wound-responsive family protein n=1 Tax=Perilla frutescens var. hirtella TaxID=608512 RepID=A0AAD4PD62_PERFH|nr:Wound-responsive family protein [Perilla frutescens var. frutescens]KAH6775696.1 Wound-responsive family protein [Perilla frutescens var. hirtella]KAH6835583.1 Wound-responsive family protein [Perilla frutescens var. hirtella]